ncbi:transcription antitermination factor NusB [Psychrilyobacter atlanticus]|uniref:transcription antitermination factor NusB n=1 Tax=Psychrilyobacter atlanticus TaxID=271091 RepID=UPI00041B5689|nr:transcription antitermination factor NusB [Psychrilyobacter atlanticus]
MSRKIAREELFKLLFEADMNKVTPLERLEEFLEDGNRRVEISEDEETPNNVEELTLTKTEVEFIKEFAAGIDKHYGTINQEIAEKMDEWSLETVGNVERSLLRFGVYELMYEETGFEIVLNEIIELAKIYGDATSHEFVNGVLAKFVKK